MLLVWETMSKLWNRYNPEIFLHICEHLKADKGSLEVSGEKMLVFSLPFSFLSFLSYPLSLSSLSLNKRVVLWCWSQSYNLWPQLPWYLGLWIWITALSNKWCGDTVPFHLKKSEFLFYLSNNTHKIPNGFNM